MINMLDKVLSTIKECFWKLSGVDIIIGKNRIRNVTLRKTEKAKLSIQSGFCTRKGMIINISDNATVVLGKSVFVNDYVCINARERIVIGDNVIIGQNVLMYDHDHDYRTNSFRNEFVSSPIEIGSNVWIGSGVIILKGVKIGENAVVSAGSIVTKDIPGNTLYRNKIVPIITSYER